jgi:hypothetical protein
MEGAAGDVECIFQPVDLASQPIPFLPQPVPRAAQLLDVSLGLLPFTSQLLDFALLPFKLGDQVVTRGGAPARSHALVMPAFELQYKGKAWRSCCSDLRLAVTTR